jgi:hypothetical protein
MQDNKKKVIILIVLVIIAVFSIMRNLRAPYRGESGITSGSGALTNTAGDIADLARTVKRSGFDTWKRSPFIPTVVAAREVPTLALSGIFWDKKKPTAIIDDEIVTVGSRIGDAVVVDIQKGFVRLNDGANDFELTLEEE